jgi:hypothetical protein
MKEDLKNVGVIDLMLEIPTGRAGMGMSQAKKLLRDRESAGFSHHPAQYLFKSSPEQMGEQLDPGAIVQMMDDYGVQMAQISVHPRQPEGALDLFNKYPTRFFGEIYVDPNRGMDAVREIEQTKKLHRNIVAVSGSPCLYNPQVPIDDKRFYPIYAKCCELNLPINMLVGVPGPRVPFACQHPGLIDEVAWFFPDLKIVMRHGGEPWTELCAKLLLKWPNVYYSTSAFAPKHYPRNILEFANKRGKDKIMFAGYYPGLSYERIFTELKDLPLREETWRPFLRDNAMAVYGLDNIAA